MRRALALARRGWGRTAPNPMVGAVLVRDGALVGSGYHAALGRDHAEVVALREAGALARGATLYVTLEPCNHHGRTPPCTDAILKAGVARVVYAVDDPHPVARGGASALHANGVEVTAGVEAEAARDLIAPFLHRFQSERPFVTLKLATSIDGAIAEASRAPGWLTGPEALREVHRLRAGHDAIAVGSGTALADDPALTVREWRRPRVAPRRVVFDRRGRLTTAARVVRTADQIPTLVVTSPEGARRLADVEASGVSLLVEPSLPEALQRLRADGIDSLLCEGGASLAGALLGHDLVDRLVIFQAPLFLGASALPAFGEVPSLPIAEARRWRLCDAHRLGDDVAMTYAPLA